MNPMKEMIADLRGGFPEKCDFCDKPTTPENLEPEEAGAWACIECVTRWDLCERHGWQPMTKAPTDKGQLIGYDFKAKKARRMYYGKTAHVPFYGWNYLRDSKDPESAELFDPIAWKSIVR